MFIAFDEVIPENQDIKKSTRAKFCPFGSLITDVRLKTAFNAPKHYAVIRPFESSQ